MARRFLTCGIVALALVASLGGQPGPRRGGPPPRGPRPGMAGPFWNPLERWLRMPPAQRERALAQLPPQRQQRIRERLEWFNNLPPQERRRLLQRYVYFSQLPPSQQDLLRRQIQHFQNTQPERRQLLAREIQRLRRMPDPDRRARLESEEFRGKYTPGEQQMLQVLSESLAAVPN